MKSDEYMTGNLAMRNHVRELKQRIADLEAGHRESERQLREWQNRTVQAEAERDRLRGAFEKYGRHLDFCDWQKHIHEHCDCGFLKALNKADTK